MQLNKKFWKGKTVAIAGGAGFIGSHFVEDLIKNKIKTLCLSSRKHDHSYLSSFSKKYLECITVDLTQEKEVLKKINNVDVIINAAAVNGNTEFKIKYATKILNHNLKIILNILNAAAKKKIKDIVIISSSEIYPLTAKNPIKEQDDYQINFDSLKNGYVLSKRIAEIIGQVYARQYNMRVYLPRPTNVYGERDRFDNDSKCVIPSIIKKIAKGESLEIWGNGKQVRNFTYVKDLVKSILAMVEFKKFCKLNISSKESISIVNLAYKIADIANCEPRLKYFPDKPTGVTKRILNVTKLFTSFGFIATSLDIGLKKTIDWYFKNK